MTEQSVYQPVIATIGEDKIIIYPRRNCRNIILRVCADGTMKASVPHGSPLAKTVSTLQKLHKQIKERTAGKTPFSYHDGWSYTYPEGSFSITRQSANKNLISLSSHDANHIIGVGDNLSFSDTNVTRTISRGILKIASKLSPQTLIPQAEEIAKRLKLDGIKWEIGKGTRTLGSCYPDRQRIIISAACLFLSHELREFIICHELAHLTHANHSADFHALCNAYLQGREKQLIHRLKHHQWPILR